MIVQEISAFPAPRDVFSKAVKGGPSAYAIRTVRSDPEGNRHVPVWKHGILPVPDGSLPL